MSESRTDRRAQARINANLKLTLSLNDPATGKTSKYTGTIINISKSGIAFKPDTPIPHVIAADIN